MDNRKSAIRIGAAMAASVCVLAVLVMWSVGKYDRKYRAELARECVYYERTLGDADASPNGADAQWAAAYLRQNCRP